MKRTSAQHGNSFDHYIRREHQLDMLGYTIVIVLIAIIGVLLVMVLSELAPTGMWLFGSYYFRVLAPGLILAFLIYLYDQHTRLRKAMKATHEEVLQAREEIKAGYEHLAFALDAATTVADLSQSDGLDSLLRDAAEHFGADAAAVVDEDIHMFALESADADAAERAMNGAATKAVTAGVPLTLTGGDTEGSVIAVPLRASGRLDSVACAWRAEGEFEQQQLDGLQLVARIIEMGADNRRLLDEAHARMEGTLRTLADLVDLRQPEYSQHSATTAELAVEVGHKMGLPTGDLEDIRVAALLHDVGMLKVPEEIITAARPLTPDEVAVVRRHPDTGAEIVKRGNLSPRIQAAIRHHHERLDGTGYPAGLTGHQIPVAARVIAVCDSYVAMTAPRPHRQALTPSEAASQLVQGVDSAYDRNVVHALLTILNARQSVASAELQSAAPL